MEALISIRPKWLERGIRIAGNVVMALFVLYYFGAIFYDGPLGQASIWNGLLALVWLGAIVFLWRYFQVRWQQVLVVVVACLVVYVPWSQIEPSNEREWAEDFTETGYVTLEGDVVHLHHFRDFDYHRNEDESWEVEPRWITKSVRLSKLQGMDIFHDRFLGNVMAHPILSFDFGEDGRVCLSIETRREVDESFSPLGGLYKMFEIQYLFASEEDVIRVRTNVREEPVNIYASSLPMDRIRYLFLSSVMVQNQLSKRPEFYNVVNANCTTSIRKQIPESERSPFDIRILVNGLLDQYLYKKQTIVSEGLSFKELRLACNINEAAEKAHEDPAFSVRIREGKPGQVTAPPDGSGD
jgi:hypothetical protein